MEEQLISFETAVLAKEKGFDIKTLYRFLGEIYREVDLNCQLWDNEYYAPTQSLLQKWLREEMDMWVTIIFNGITYSISIYGRYTPDEEEIEISNTGSLNFEDKYFLRYEQALEVGLQEALKLI
jgi:hypothetical protein